MCIFEHFFLQQKCIIFNLNSSMGVFFDDLWNYYVISCYVLNFDCRTSMISAFFWIFEKIFDGRVSLETKITPSYWSKFASQVKTYGPWVKSFTECPLLVQTFELSFAEIQCNVYVKFTWKRLHRKRTFRTFSYTLKWTLDWSKLIRLDVIGRARAIFCGNREIREAAPIYLWLGCV